MQVLIRDEAEELVFDQRTGESSAGNVAVQLRVLVCLWNTGVLLEEERGRIQEIRAAMSIQRAMNLISARLGIQIDMRPEAEPCETSYIEAFTRTSCNVSGGGVGMAFPIER